MGEPLDRAEAEELLAELTSKLPPPGGSFGVMVDARRARAFSVTTLDVLKRGILLLQEHGMRRRAVIVTSPIVMLQGKRLSRETGTLAWTRYIHTNDHPEWHKAAVNWLVSGLDPDR